VPDELIPQALDLPGGELRLLQPADGAEIPDDHEVQWAPLAPYWSVLWRSGVALAREVDRANLTGRRVVELGCGLAAPSLAAARAGAEALATDRETDPLELAARNAAENGLEVETMAVEWEKPDSLVEKGPFDLVLASDVLYERQSVSLLLKLLPRLAPEAWVADPGRPASEAFFEQALSRWGVETRQYGVVGVHRIRLD
jgi:predicted nicotinamide N-methyase